MNEKKTEEDGLNNNTSVFLRHWQNSIGTGKTFKITFEQEIQLK